MVIDRRTFIPRKAFGYVFQTVVLKLPQWRFSCTLWRTLREGVQIMATATLDWSQCPAVESIPGKRSGAWVFRGTRMPVSTVFENLQDMSVDEIVEEFGVTREQVQAVLQFAAHTAEAPAPRP
jgi:uncharacterized protein (DUF433 family)